MPAMEGDDGGSQAGDRAVGAVGAERDLREREGIALSMRPLYHSAAAPSPPAATAIAALAANAVFAGNSALLAKSAFPRR